jgi:hypothetical protein
MGMGFCLDADIGGTFTALAEDYLFSSLCELVANPAPGLHDGLPGARESVARREGCISAEAAERLHDFVPDFREDHR